MRVCGVHEMEVCGVHEMEVCGVHKIVIVLTICGRKTSIMHPPPPVVSSARKGKNDI